MPSIQEVIYVFNKPPWLSFALSPHFTPLFLTAAVRKAIACKVESAQQGARGWGEHYWTMNPLWCQLALTDLLFNTPLQKTAVNKVIRRGFCVSNEQIWTQNRKQGNSASSSMVSHHVSIYSQRVGAFWHVCKRGKVTKTALKWADALNISGSGAKITFFSI